MAPRSSAAPLLAASLSALVLIACRGDGDSVHVDFLHPEVELSTGVDGRVHLDGAFDFTATLSTWSDETEAEIWLDKLDVTTPDATHAPVVGEIRVPEGASLFPLAVGEYSYSTVRVPFTGTSLEMPGDELAWLCSIGRPMELQGTVYDAETGAFQSFYDAASQLQGPMHEIMFSRKDSASRPLPPRFASSFPQGLGDLTELDVEHAWGGFVLGGSLFSSLNLGDRQISADGAGDAVLVRFDAQGNVLWDHKFSNIGMEGISSLSQRDGADLFVGGHYDYTIDLGAGVLQNPTSGYGSFVARMSEAGTTVWSTGFIEDVAPPLAICTLPYPRIAARPDGGVSFVKSLHGTISFASGPIEVTPPVGDCGPDLLVGAYDAEGALLYASRFGDGYAQQALDVAVDDEGTTWLVGGSVGVLDFGHGLPPIVGPWIVSPPETRLFVAAFDPQGTPILARDLGQVLLRTDDQVRLAVRPGGGVVVAGAFTGVIDVGMEPLVSTGPGNDGFVVALDATGSPIWGQHFDHPPNSVVEAFTLADVAVAEDGRVVLAGRATSSFSVGGQPLPGGTSTFGGGLGSALFALVLDPAGAPLGHRVLSCNGGRFAALDVGAGEVSLVSAVLGYSEGKDGLLPRNDGALWMGRLALDP
ncbi:hypothetical protein [Polyangium fumosum]|uniref:Uncharacterized protein n=1 Tax=Polyangium fumosum TaxID=889272 RepID=A0A4U1IQ60_9BACT|nr:hypothetical protein [Polyangium fumosum]TKC96346.1 hypothetical protein E8A74_45915 [Polyangium fumosum]